MTNSAALWRARNLSAGHDGRSVLRGVDFAIYPGEVWFFVGANGSGKSTLLLTLLGLLPAIEGEVTRCPQRAGADRVGFVPQRGGWPDTLPTTVREFVELGLAGLPGPFGQKRDSTLSALRVMGLEDLAERDYRSLSGGQRQRTRVARALVRNPTLLILDEPTSGLDHSSIRQFFDELMRLRRERSLTLLIVTHEWNLARTYATHAARVEVATVRAGPAAEILKEWDGFVREDPA